MFCGKRFCALALFSILSCASCSEENLKISSITRKIDISSQVVEYTVDYVFVHVGGSSEVNSFVHLLCANESANLAFISSTDQAGRMLTVRKSELVKRKNFVAYQIDLLDILHEGEELSASVSYFVTQFLKPFPASVTQLETQLVVYEGNAYLASIYPISKITTNIVLPTGKLEYYTYVSPSKAESSQIVYGPYEDVKPLSVEKIKIHAENNSPFIVATEIERLIEVSHWGNIAVEDKINLMHKGAQLKGPFSRIDIQLDRRGSRKPYVTHYQTLLPASAKDIYYRDEIGNISTSDVRKVSDSVQLTIQPRFPLFGGWKTDYIIGYNLPAYRYLFSLGSAFALKMNIMDRLFAHAVVDHLKLRIMLPEGSKNFHLITPYPVKRLPDEVFQTYLDTYGRPVIVIEKSNLIDEHIQQFTLYYEFDRILLWCEPLLVCIAFALLFLAVMIYVRLDFTIVSDSSAETRLQAQGIIEQFVELHADRLKAFDQYSSAADKLKNNKDLTAFANVRKKVDAELKIIMQTMSDLQAELKSNPEATEKLNDSLKLHKTSVELINNYLAQAERFVKGQVSRASLLETEKNFHQKLNDLKERMDSLIYAL